MRFNTWWAHRDLNTGPTDYEFYNLHIETQEKNQIYFYIQ